MKMSRSWAMPSAETFSIKPISDFVNRYAKGIVVDPFSRNSTIATYTNDINPDTDAMYHMDAVDFLGIVAEKGIEADCVIFDPPYSPRQITECYAAIGKKATMQDTQSASFKAKCREQIRRITKQGGVVLSFGWNTVGHGPEFEIVEILLVCHGGDHNDTICMAERRLAKQSTLEV